MSVTGYDNDDVFVKGDDGSANGQKIGVVGDRLKVATGAFDTNGSVFLNFSKHLENASGSREASVDGSVTPVDFSEGPATGEVWFVYEMTFSIIDNGVMSAEKFGTLPQLATPGLQFIAKIGGVEHVITRVRDNIEINQEFSSVIFTVGSAGESASGWLDEDDSFTGTQVWKVPTKLVGDNGDKIIMRVNNNLSSIDAMSSRILYYGAV